MSFDQTDQAIADMCASFERLAVTMHELSGLLWEREKEERANAHYFAKLAKPGGVKHPKRRWVKKWMRRFGP